VGRCGGLIYLVQDKEQWWALVNVAINLHTRRVVSVFIIISCLRVSFYLVYFNPWAPFPQKMKGKLLTSWVTVSFPRSNLLYGVGIWQRSVKIYTIRLNSDHHLYKRQNSKPPTAGYENVSIKQNKL
jgi:hypothetical protein